MNSYTIKNNPKGSKIQKLQYFIFITVLDMIIYIPKKGITSLAYAKLFLI